MTICATFDLTSFENLKAPKLHDLSINFFKYPQADDIFNKVFYMEDNGKITALKILAWAVHRGFSMSNYLEFLIQTPGSSPKWHKFDSPIYASVNDLVSCKNIVRFNMISCHELHLEESVGARRGESWYTFPKSFQFNNELGHVIECLSRIRYFIGTPDGIFIGLEHTEEDMKESADEAKAAHFNGMEVVDFAEPIVVNIKIEIPQTDIVVKTLTLK